MCGPPGEGGSNGTTVAPAKDTPRHEGPFTSVPFPPPRSLCRFLARAPPSSPQRAGLGTGISRPVVSGKTKGWRFVEEPISPSLRGSSPPFGFLRFVGPGEGSSNPLAPVDSPHPDHRPEVAMGDTRRVRPTCEGPTVLHVGVSGNVGEEPRGELWRRSFGDDEGGGRGDSFREWCGLQ